MTYAHGTLTCYTKLPCRCGPCREAMSVANANRVRQPNRATRPAPHATPDTTWMEFAACAGADADLFFAEPGHSTAYAKAICATCPVQADCLDYAMRTREIDGVWGGTTARERRNLRRRQRTA